MKTYDANFKEILSYACNFSWDAVRLKNGNTLITTDDHTVREVNKQGETVWKFSQEDAPEYKFIIFQEACRLENGNTVICNWCPHNLDPKYARCRCYKRRRRKNNLGVE